jgi:heptosyltransferase-3
MRRLLIRPGAIGDVILSLPVMEYLKADYTEVWVPSAVVPLIQFADKVISLAASRIDVMADGFAERFQPFDEVVSWYRSNQQALSALQPRCLFHRALPPDECTLHASIAVKPVLARETVVIHPFSGSAKKDWPLDAYHALAERLPLPVEWAHERFDNLLELATWMAGARLYIGNDSGITHLAAAAGVPTIAIFGPTNPEIWAPREAKVLRTPALDEVLNAAIEQLACARP